MFKKMIVTAMTLALVFAAAGCTAAKDSYPETRKETPGAAALIVSDSLADENSEVTTLEIKEENEKHRQEDSTVVLSREKTPGRTVKDFMMEQYEKKMNTHSAEAEYQDKTDAAEDTTESIESREETNSTNVAEAPSEESVPEESASEYIEEPAEEDKAAQADNNTAPEPDPNQEASVEDNEYIDYSVEAEGPEVPEMGILSNESELPEEDGSTHTHRWSQFSFNIHHDAEYATIHHPASAEGHYETTPEGEEVWVPDVPAWDEEVLVKEAYDEPLSGWACRDCGKLCWQEEEPEP